MVLGFNHFDVDATSILYGPPLIVYMHYIHCHIFRIYNNPKVLVIYDLVIHVSFEILQDLKKELSYKVI